MNYCQRCGQQILWEDYKEWEDWRERQEMKKGIIIQDLDLPTCKVCRTLEEYMWEIFFLKDSLFES